MVRLTPEQVKGTKFEIWTEYLLRELGFNQVRRNIVYHRQRYHFRQVDVEYKDRHWFNPLIILEMKYSGNGKIGLQLRGGKKKKSGQRLRTIDNLVSEVEERRKFVKARKAFLITNNYFTDELMEAAGKNRRIQLYDRDALVKLDNKRAGLLGFFYRRKPLEEQMKTIDLRKYRLDARRHYV